MFNFRQFPTSSIALQVEVFTKPMLTYLSTISPGGWREGHYVYFCSGHGLDPEQDAADFIARFEGYVIGVEDAPARPEPVRGSIPDKAYGELIAGVTHVRR